MSVTSLRQRALTSAVGIAVAVVLPFGGAALAPSATAATAPATSTAVSTSAAATSAPLTAAQLAAKKKAAAKKRAAAKRAAKKRAAHRKALRELKRGKKLIKVASRYRGAPYVYGAAGPRAFDCSGFTSFVVRKALKVNLPRVAAAQAYTSKVKKVSKKNRKVGDLIFFARGGGISHVAFYAGNGKMWDAPRTGYRINKRPIHSGVVRYARIKA